MNVARPVPTALDWLRVNLAIGTLSFGSASRIVLYEDAVVRDRGWLSAAEFVATAPPPPKRKACSCGSSAPAIASSDD